MTKLALSTGSLAFLALAIPTALAQSPAWLRQLGTTLFDQATAAAPDGEGGLLVVGRTGSSLGGTHAGNLDVWLARYDGVGQQKWSRQFGTSDSDYPWAAAPDGSGGVFLGGLTGGYLGGPHAGGSADAWLAHYDGAGNRTWIRQFGTPDDDETTGAAPDGSGGVYACGRTPNNLGGTSAGFWDPWLARYDAVGNRIWIRQFGTSGVDYAYAAASDGSDGVYVGGWTDGSLGGPHAGGVYDAWLAHYDGAGNQSWIRQLGTASGDYLRAAAPDGAGGVYVGGRTRGSLGAPSAGGYDAWVARYDPLGNPGWIRQLGTSADDLAYGFAPDGSGGVYLVGYTAGSLGAPSAGSNDAWMARYDGAGNLLWLHQIGTSAGDIAFAAATDGHGGLYLGGGTTGSLGGPYAGGIQDDVWFGRYVVPWASAFCSAGTTTHGCVPSITASGSASASASSGFTLTVHGVEGQKKGLIFYGVDNAGFTPIPWGSSLLCIAAPLQRTVLLDSGGTLGACDGALALDWNAFRAAHPQALGQPFEPGQLVFAQGWFRDMPAPSSANLSDALEFLVQP